MILPLSMAMTRLNTVDKRRLMSDHKNRCASSLIFEEAAKSPTAPDPGCGWLVATIRLGLLTSAGVGERCCSPPKARKDHLCI
jgi:hypothetical protein